ncbi:MAG: alpha/beta hydrolase [Bacteroidia bacterium]|nr:alpha/beta hydrolase [Bacteroidia bacterium]
MLGSLLQAQSLYIRTFGVKEDPALVFLHGGPGYNAASFELSTAQTLADSGFYVIVYDRRGEGRSPNAKAAYTFKESFSDLAHVYKSCGIRKATLLGHSFGGILGTLFSLKYPEKVDALILAGAPVNLQESFTHIRNRSKSIYIEKKDHANLKYIYALEKMDSTSMEYASYCFMHAMQNGFYSPAQPTEEAQDLYTKMRADPQYKLLSDMSREAPAGFWRNEQYTTLDLAPQIKELCARKFPVYAVYGREDGLYSPAQVQALQHILGAENLLYPENCSHNVFIDQQGLFIRFLKQKRSL